ncbi:MAG TPA: type II secretion system F family protein [Hyphomicrobiaceae bacterium]|jgi:general secretion pathway protein F
MPTFRYQAYGDGGELAQGSVEAASQAEATEVLFLRGLTAFRLEAAGEAATPWWQREVFASRRSLATELAALTRELATLIGAEIPLDQALRVVSDQAATPRMRALAARLLADVLNGAALSEAMQRRQGIFSAEYTSIVRAGEVGGTLGQVFGELADLLERRLEVRGQVQSALIYPLILVAFSLVTLGVVVAVLVPGIASVFAESGRSLPPAVQFLVAVQSRWPEVLAGTATAAIGGTIAVVLGLRRPGIALALDRRKLRVPVLAGLVLHQETARFAHTLGTLLRAGVPLLQAADAASAALRNRHVAAGMERAIGRLREGARLHAALERETVLPPLALRMIAVGEEAGKLSAMLLRAAAVFEQQTKRSVDRLMTLLTPVLTLTMALLVGGIIITVMNAILSINELAVR